MQFIIVDNLSIFITKFSNSVCIVVLLDTLPVSFGIKLKKGDCHICWGFPLCASAIVQLTVEAQAAQKNLIYCTNGMSKDYKIPLPATMHLQCSPIPLLRSIYNDEKKKKKKGTDRLGCCTVLINVPDLVRIAHKPSNLLSCSHCLILCKWSLEV